MCVLTDRLDALVTNPKIGSLHPSKRVPKPLAHPCLSFGHKNDLPLLSRAAYVAALFLTRSDLGGFDKKIIMSYLVDEVVILIFYFRKGVKWAKKAVKQAANQRREGVNTNTEVWPSL